MRRRKFAYSIGETLEEVPVGRGTLYREIRENRLRVTKIGRRTVILADDLRAWLERLRTNSQRSAGNK